MSNEIIGIAGCFGFTVLLFLLRYIYLSIGRSGTNRRFTHTKLTGDRELTGKTAGDDSWLLWTPDQKPEAGSPKRAGHS